MRTIKQIKDDIKSLQAELDKAELRYESLRPSDILKKLGWAYGANGWVPPKEASVSNDSNKMDSKDYEVEWVAGGFASAQGCIYRTFKVGVVLLLGQRVLEVNGLGVTVAPEVVDLTHRLLHAVSKDYVISHFKRGN